jgi:DEAD/DEAH box helicase domain-containing protein
MPFKSYLAEDFTTTHEREFFDKLINLLHTEFDYKEELYVLIGNLSCEGKDIDAVFIKKDAIIVIDFKNYGGNLQFSENGDWMVDNIVVKGGASGKNPYRQIKDNKFALLSIMNLLLTFRNVNLGHITCLILFQQPITFDDTQIPQKIKTWLHISDFTQENIIKKINNITSNQINLSEKEIDNIINRFNLKRHIKSQTYLKQENQLNSKGLNTKNILKNIQNLENNSATSIIQEEIQTKLKDLGFKIVHSLTIPGRDAKFKNIDDLNLSQNVSNFLERYKNQVYIHQYQSLKLYKENKNICISTSTSSGKSDIFYSCGIDLRSKIQDANILAIYPLKALGNQQVDRWKKAIELSKLENTTVGIIDGSIEKKRRFEIISINRIIIMTPDVIHSWLLANLEDARLKNFLKKIKMIVIDEIHTYTGVFGSNSSYLFRRLNHAIKVLSGKIPQYITASATVESPDKHLEKLTGLQFEIIDVSFDSSGKHNIDVLLIETYDPKTVLTKTTEAIFYFANETDNKFIAFFDSRKMVEQVAHLIKRLFKNEKVVYLDQLDNSEDNSIEDLDNNLDLNLLNVIPYRSGYETSDSKEMQERLMTGQIKGVISTSALEMGIDIKDLNLGILLGIPNSSTSFYQRIGRIGRHQNGLILIINDYSVRSSSIFKNPKDLLNIPLADGALYLENEYLQYIHSLCFAKRDQEYDKIQTNDENFETHILFPSQFINMCIDERNGIVPHHLQMLKTQIGTSPNLTYPLRDLESQFEVIQLPTHIKTRRGSLSFSQVMKEAYPLAIYYYMTIPYRVKKVDLSKKQIFVVKSKHYTTQPIFAPTLIFPNLTIGNIHFGKKFGDVKILECNLQILENIIGIKERRGSQELSLNYPIDNEYGDYKNNRFSRNYFTSGILISHDSLNDGNVQSDIIAKVLYEVFLSVIPFEAQDIGFGKDKIRVDRFSFKLNERFICIFDKTYGSLRLTSRLTDLNTLKQVFDKAMELVQDKENQNIFGFEIPIHKKTINTIGQLRINLDKLSEDIIHEDSTIINEISDKCYQIILPFFGTGIGTKSYEKSVGLSSKNNEEFYIKNIIIDKDRLYYRGFYKSESRKNVNGQLDSNITHQIQCELINPTEESAIAIYNINTQEIVN